MKRRDVFNQLFDNGFDYETYLTRSDRQKPRMELAIKTAEEEAAKLDSALKERLNKKMKILLIGENWCGDCANAVPVVAAFTSIFDQWEFKIFGKDDIEDEEILDFYTTAGRMKIPVVIFADEDGDEVTRWAERPARSYRILYDLQLQRLPKEEYMALYKSHEDLKTDSVAREIFRELFEKAEYVVSMLQILPKKRN
ncbi:MAG: thioredoxin family protein [Candidatus Heimdallarchaeota archaeon]|nr:thioredoxin family protein [Candidatus Heimdallarchaeota archaeon]